MNRNFIRMMTALTGPVLAVGIVTAGLAAPPQPRRR